MDSILLRRLQAKGRETWAALALELKVTGPAVAERVRKLEDRGVIRGYTAIVDPEAVGYGLLAFIAVSLQSAAHRDAFLAKVAELSEIQECHHVAGDDDYLIKVRCRSTLDLDRLITEELRALSGIIRTRTTIVLKTVKETSTVPIEGSL